MKIKKSIYGLRQSPRNWKKKFNAGVVELGFRPTYSDPCLYTYGSGDTFAMMTLYLDDCLLTEASTKVLTHLRELLQSRFAVSDLGQASFVLGMIVHHDKEESTIRISQDSYTESLLTR
ncbi:unnamed protein product, partial [Sphacelaria rigidula]